MSKELLKDTLLGMRLSKKESEVIKGGIAANTASAMSSATISSPTISFEVAEAAKFCLFTICSSSCLFPVCHKYGTD